MAAVTNDLTTGVQPPSQTKSLLGVQEIYVDFTDAKNQVTIAAGNTNTLQVGKVSAGTIVKAIDAIVDTAEGEAVTATVGDGDNPDGFIASLNLNSATGTIGAGAYTAAYGKYYAADDTIDLVIANSSGSAITLDTGKLRLIVQFFAQ